MTAPVPARPRCADAAQAAGDPLEGTAPPADHWFLVEHPGPWDRYILAGSGFDRTVASTLDRWARTANGRVLEPAVYETAGSATFVRTLDGIAGSDIEVRFSVDRTLPSEKTDSRERGIIVVSIQVE